MKKPEICDSLESVQVSLYKEDVGTKLKTNYKQLLTDVITNKVNSSVEEIDKKKEELIEQFISLFENEMMRKPTLSELCSNLISDSTKIDKEYLTVYWYKHNRQDSTALTIDGEGESKGETDGVEMTTL